MLSAGKKAKKKSIENCEKLVALLEKHGECPTSTIKERTGLTNLHTSHIFTFNDLLREQRKPFRISTRAVGSNRELYWSLRAIPQHFA
jgi:hypothetical protein